MNTALPLMDYLLGHHADEHERLIRQARTLAPYTERLLRDAGIAAGQRVLDVGSGVGDMTLLAASLVGATGEVIGIDRDEAALAKARHRARSAELHQVSFLPSDLAHPEVEGDFDAIVGRFILLFLPDAAATLRLLATRLRPGGVMVFQEPSWASFRALAGHLPLRRACADAMCRTLERAGAHPDMALTLYQGLCQPGFATPHLRVEVPMAEDVEGERWLSDLMHNLLPRFKQLGVSTNAIGPMDTLAARLSEEIPRTRSYAPLLGLAGAWARRAD